MMSPMTSAPRAVTPVPRRPRPPVPLQKRRASPMRNIVQTVPAKDNFSVRNRGPAVAPTATASKSTLTVPLTEEALRRLRRTRSLFLCCRNLVSLSHVRHLEHMTGLVSLNAHMNAITRLGGIGHLRQLTELDVSANELRSVDADAFVGLVHLRRLNLSSNFLSSISGLEHLSALEWLSLSFNQLTDISALRRLQAPALLTHLDVCGNRIATCRALEDALAQCAGLRELRVETPQGALVVPSAPPHLRLRENAFCAAEPNYAERLLRLFPRLERLNGVACGVDPTQSQSPLPLPLPLQSAEDNFAEACGGTAPMGPLSKDSLKMDPFPIDSFPIDSLPSGPLAAAAALDSGSDLPALLCDESASSNDSDNDDNDEEEEEEERRRRRRRWRAKRVSRGVVTDLSLPPRECFLCAGDSAAEASQQSALLIARLEASQLRAQEQMALRAVHEADLRRHVEDARRAARASAEEARRLALQVAALKEELSRRAEEAALVARRSRAEVAALKNERRTQQQREAHSARVLMLVQEERCARLAVEARALEALAGAAQCAAKEMREVCQAQRAARRRERSQWDAQWNALRRELVAAQPKPKSDCGCDPIGSVCDAAEARRAAEALDEARACCDEMREALAAAVEKAKDAMHQAAVANERAVVEAKRAVENKEAADAAISEAKAMAETRDAAISEAKAMAEARDAAISEAKAMAEARDAAITEAKAMAEARDAAISEAKAMAEAAAGEAVSHAMAEAQRERDNLLRTVRNLRDTIAAKDAALDDLEEEAKAKLDEKRSAIARLEAELRGEGGGDAGDRRRAMAELEKTAARQAALLQRAAEALARARAQLARVDAVNERLEREAKEAAEAREAKDAELRRVQAQWREAQDSSRARQRATLQALAQMMADGSEAAT